MTKTTSRLGVFAILTMAATACQPPKREAQRPVVEQPTTATRAATSPELGKGKNPLAPYIQYAVLDQFNPDVTDEERRLPLHPRHGGEIVIRVPSDLRTLMPLLHTTVPERGVMVLLQDSLITRHAEVLEYVPRMAAWWIVRDYVEKRGGERIEGLVTTQTVTSVQIIPRAGIWTFLCTDVLTSDPQAGWIETRFGQRLQGEVTLYHHTVAVEEKPSTPPMTIAVDELSTWTNTIGDQEQIRRSIKPRCIYEFRLRDGIQWHDGRPVTMQDLKCGFETMRNEKVDCAHLRLYYLDVEKLDVLDPLTAKFTYKKPYYLALDFCGSLEFIPHHVMRPERFVDDPEGYAQFYNKHPMGQPGEGRFVGIGPYKLDHWTAGLEVVLVRNDNWWASRADLGYNQVGQPYLDKITFRVIVEKTPALRELENGHIDADFDIEPDTWFLAQTQTPTFTANIVRAKHTVPMYTYIGWNLERTIFQDKTVRRALSMLVPRERIRKEIHRGLAQIAEGPFYEDGPSADRTVEPIRYDPAEARRLLRQAGWIDRDGDGVLEDRDGRRFEFEYMIHTGREYHSKIADVIKQSLGQAGIQVNIRRVDWTVFSETVRDHNFDAVRFAWSDALDGDPYQIWHSSQSKGRGSNHVSYANKEVDTLIERGREEFDPIERWGIHRRIYRIIHDEQPYSFMFVFDSLVFYSKKFRGVKFYTHDPSYLGYDLTEWYLNQ